MTFARHVCWLLCFKELDMFIFWMINITQHIITQSTLSYKVSNTQTNYKDESDRSIFKSSRHSIKIRFYNWPAVDLHYSVALATIGLHDKSIENINWFVDWLLYVPIDFDICMIYDSRHHMYISELIIRCIHLVPTYRPVIYRHNVRRRMLPTFGACVFANQDNICRPFKNGQAFYIRQNTHLDRLKLTRRKPWLVIWIFKNTQVTFTH